MNALVYIPSCLLLVLLGVLVRGRAYRSLPFFFSYSVFAVAADLARFSTHNHSHLYHHIYWGTEAVYEVLGILVMHEVLRRVFVGLSYLWWFRFILPAALLAGIGLSIARAHSSPIQASSTVAYYIVCGEIAVRVVQVIIFAGLVTLVPVLGLRWRQYSFGVATGFGLYATVALLVTVKLSDFGTRFMFLWNLATLVAYSLTVMIWIWFFSVPQRPQLLPGSNISTPSPGDLKHYKDALRRMR